MSVYMYHMDTKLSFNHLYVAQNHSRVCKILLERTWTTHKKQLLTSNFHNLVIIIYINDFCLNFFNFLLYILITGRNFQKQVILGKIDISGFPNF